MIEIFQPFGVGQECSSIGLGGLTGAAAFAGALDFETAAEAFALAAGFDVITDLERAAAARTRELALRDDAAAILIEPAYFFFAAVFLAGAFFGAAFLAAGFLAAVFFTTVFFAAAFFAGAFLTAVFFAAGFFGVAGISG